MPGHVTLESLDEKLLAELLHAAVAEADPGEVMPVEGPGAGWKCPAGNGVPSVPSR
ncbi:hypothetical protein AB0M45_21165 [Nocardia sp. NPDC051787]|uniref:hypothetical protein n=1 Tax=Nocardia sp. NPDC051787 TaxID=3155415 RepID=UPI0034421CB6